MTTIGRLTWSESDEGARPLTAGLLYVVAELLDQVTIAPTERHQGGEKTSPAGCVEARGRRSGRARQGYSYTTELNL
jgi:hypothetical protein